MPANEQTWRDQKRTHVIFGVSSVVMLLATIWMFGADHDREWKGYQKQYYWNLETWNNQARVYEKLAAEYQTSLADLRAALEQQRGAVPDKSLLKTYLDAAAAAPGGGALDSGRRESIEARHKRLADADDDDLAQRAELRSDLLAALRELQAVAKFNEQSKQTELKFRRADFDVARSEYNLSLGAGADQRTLDQLQATVDRVNDEVMALSAEDEALNSHRKQLDVLLAELTAGESEAAKALDDYETDLRRLETALSEVSAQIGKTVVGLPILDAFNNTEIGIKQIWLPELTINYNFKGVARFDRCTTCHLGIEKTAPGSATEPGYQQAHEIQDIALETPEQAPEGEDVPSRLLAAYGIQLSDRGVFHPNDVTIEYVLPGTRGADARLRRGDVMTYVGDAKITSVSKAAAYLLDRAAWGEPLVLSVRRGTPQPFSSHPRLDLLAGSTSPHPVADFGCTICHDGQGSATAFKWASHTPNSLKQRGEWSQEHGWFNNHHWIFPMSPKRFIESNCLKCHHDVDSLAPSERFPDPPAPKLMEGYDIVRQYACFGCHEINGYDGPDKTIGPDLRLEPNYTYAALQLHVDTQLNDAGVRQRMEAIFADAAAVTPDNAKAVKFADALQQLSQRLITDPTDAASRRLLRNLVIADEARAANPKSDQPAYLQPSLHKLGSVLADVETPGRLRKAGPSLRYVASKLDKEFLFDWISNPTRYRGATRMPRFFGLHSHLTAGVEHHAEHHGDSEPEADPHASEELQETVRLETIEVLGIVHALQKSSQPFVYSASAQGDGSAESGKLQFGLRCLACHTHKDFPDGKQTQGPDLTGLGPKLVGEKGRRWLETWLRNPSHYHPRTRMPNLFLGPDDEQPGGKSANDDPADYAADIAAYLLQSPDDDDADDDDAIEAPPVDDGLIETFPAGYEPIKTPPIDNKTLHSLALEHLRGAFSEVQARKYLQDGIPEELAGELKGDEFELLGKTTDANRQEKMLSYVGRRSISKYGCYACHDIPGFEAAKPIATALADWGRKDPSKLAFEQIGKLVELTDGGGSSHGNGRSGGGHGLDLENMQDRDKAFFLASLTSHQREGFLWQKLREPRSYDYKTTQNKRYNERLRMPRFRFAVDDDEAGKKENARRREAVMTFILGLLSEPPAEKYLFQPDERTATLIEGRGLLKQFNCGGCHTLQEESWEFEFDPTHPDFAADRKFPANEYPYFQSHYTSQKIADSRKLDLRGMGRARITAHRVVGEDGTIQELEDDEGRILQVFQLWEPALINGQSWLVGQQVPILPEWINQDGYRPPVGGDLARLIHPVVLAAERKKNPQAKYADAWGWVPPPLIREGAKVQTDWLHEFLLEPYLIRPAIALRMPKFNLSPAQASALANYFAAKDNVQYPFEFDPRTQTDHLAAMNRRFADRLDDAMKVVTNGNYCIKCHLVGDFTPKGDAVAQAPNLQRIFQRFRPRYLQNWLANPKRLLPYTGMPENFTQGKPARAAGFTIPVGKLIQDGSAPDQLQAVVDLLLNYDQYLRQKVSILPLINDPPKPPAENN